MINLNNKIKLIYSLSGTFLTILILTVISITGYSFVQNKNHLFHLSSGVMVKSNDIIYQKISSFLEPATILPKMTAEFIGNEKINHKNNDQIEKYFLTILETYPQFQACFIGLESGDFIMCRRTSQGYQSKIIHRKLNRQLIKTLNKDKIQISIEEKKPDYDPRKRAWYSGALGSENVFWTKVYTFFTEKAPGVTASHRLSGQVEGVFGIDILLSDLIMFIRKQNLAYKGNIVLLDDKKNVIAASGNLSNLR